MRKIFNVIAIVCLFVTSGVITSCKKGGSNNDTNTPPVVKTYSLDASFNAAESTVMYVAVQQDGKIIIANNQQIKRLNKDGSVDNGFALGSASNGEIHALALQENGKVIVTGSFKSFNGKTKNYAIRLNADGTDDNTINLVNIHPQAGDGEDIRTVTILPGGQIIMAGNFFYYTGSDYEDDVAHERNLKGLNSCIRLTTTGSLDNTFSQIIFGNPYFFNVLKDGGLVITGDLVSPYSYAQGSYNICKLLPDGSADKSFIAGSLILDNPPSNLGTGKTVTVQDDGKLIIGGLFTSYGTDANPDKNYQGIIRLESSGYLDASFTPPTNFFKSVNSVFMLDDGRMLVGSSDKLNVFTPKLNQGFTVLNKNGTIDDTFNLPVPKYGHINTIIKGSDNSIYVAGQIVQDKNNPAGSLKGIVRLKIK